MIYLVSLLMLFSNALTTPGIQQGHSHQKQYCNTQDVHNDSIQLSAINAQFIKNYITQDVKAHAKIIHEDFVCIEGDGTIIDRETYLENWATDYSKSGCTSFTFANECIRIFGSIALVRSKTTAVRLINGKSVTGHTIYTDTYKKENNTWRCIQVQITPVK